jgi:hypothetical protein
MDENEETMARLDMLVDLWRRSQEEDNELDLMQPAMDSTAHWRLGSPDSQVLSHHLDVSRDLLFHDFNFRLREYLANHHGSHLVSSQDDIKVYFCSLVAITDIININLNRLSPVKFSTLSISPWWIGDVNETSYAATLRFTACPVTIA